jgi:hypothetical protein
MLHEQVAQDGISAAGQFCFCLIRLQHSDQGGRVYG